jgi:hypothetical protein
MLKIYCQKEEYLKNQNFFQYVCYYLPKVTDFWLRKNDIKQFERYFRGTNDKIRYKNIHAT